MFHVKPFVFTAVLFPFFCSAQHIGSSTLPIKAMPELPFNDSTILKYLENNPEYETLAQNKKEWFYWTNYSRSNPKRFWDSVVFPILVNYPTLKNTYTASLKRDLYISNALPLVKPNAGLVRTSQAFANDLSSKNAPPSHTSPSGTTFADRMKMAGVTRCAGENIGLGPLDPVLMLVLLYIDEGVPDLGHRKTLLNPSFVTMGIGVANYPGNKSIVIQDFSCE